MRNMIRRWLGIKDVTREDLESVIFSETFIDTVSVRIASKLAWREQDSIRKEVADITRQWIDRTINNEKFIDDVVQRIRNKQI